MVKTVAVLERQTVIDIAIQQYGHADAADWVVLDNNLGSITEVLTAGQLLIVNRDPMNKNMVNYYTRNDYNPANSFDETLGTTAGDFNNDFNNDYLK